MQPHKPSNLSDNYWNNLSEQHRALYAIVRPAAAPTYTVDLQLASVESFLQDLHRDMEDVGGRARS